MEKRCKNCMHFKKFNNVQGNAGLCRGVSPMVFLKDSVYETRWPVVEGDEDWCFMHFKPNIKKIPLVAQ